MPALRKYPDELGERAIRLAMDARKDPATRPGALRRVAEQLGINPGTLQGWVSQAEIGAGHDQRGRDPAGRAGEENASFAGRTASSARELIKFSV